MKTLLLMFCVLCTASLSYTQTIKQVEYFIDKDKGVGKNIKIILNGPEDSSYNFTADVSALTTGYHKLYLRTKDSKGKWSLSAQKSFEVIIADTQAAVTAGEYFYDTDPGYGKGKKINVSPQDSLIAEDFNTVTSSLGKGYHKLYARFKDSYGKWSIAAQKTVEIIKTTDTAKIIAVEYFFDDDKGYRRATEKTFASASGDSTFKFKIPYNKIPGGSDTLFIRAEDSLGNWSITKYALFSLQSSLNKSAVADATTNTVINGMQVSLFPNPASNVLHYSLNNMMENMKLTIMNVKDEMVRKVQQPARKEGEINIGNLANGIYILQFSNGIKTFTARFIKQ